MSDDDHIYVLDSTLLDDKSQLVSVGCKNSVVEDGCEVVWLETRQRYLTLEEDASCVNGKYVMLNSVCWFEMKGYRFPPRDSSTSHLQPGTYYLVQRIKTHDFRAYFHGQIKFTLTGLDMQTNERSEIATFLFDIEQLADSRSNWSVFAVGRFAIVHPSVIELSLLSTDGRSWKSGFSWDYFEILAVESPLLSLKENCFSTIIDHFIASKNLKQNNKLAAQRKATSNFIETLALPPVIISQITNYAMNPPGQLILHSFAAELNDYDASSSDGESDDSNNDDDETGEERDQGGGVLSQVYRKIMNRFAKNDE